DSRSRTGDDREPGLRQQGRGFLRRGVHRVVRPRASGPEDRNPHAYAREDVEPFAELACYPHHATRYAAGEVGDRPAILQELAVLCGATGDVIPDGLIDDLARRSNEFGAIRLRVLRRRLSAGRPVPLLRPLAQVLPGSGLGRGPHFGSRPFAARSLGRRPPLRQVRRQRPLRLLRRFLLLERALDLLAASLARTVVLLRFAVLRLGRGATRWLLRSGIGHRWGSGGA